MVLLVLVPHMLMVLLVLVLVLVLVLHMLMVLPVPVQLMALLAVPCLPFCARMLQLLQLVAATKVHALGSKGRRQSSLVCSQEGQARSLSQALCFSEAP